MIRDEIVTGTMPHLSIWPRFLDWPCDALSIMNTSFFTGITVYVCKHNALHLLQLVLGYGHGSVHDEPGDYFCECINELLVEFAMMIKIISFIRAAMSMLVQ